MGRTNCGTRPPKVFEPLDRSGLDYITDEGGGRSTARRSTSTSRTPSAGAAAVDHPARLQPARTFRSRVRRQRWRAQATVMIHRALMGSVELLRRADRALPGAFPAWRHRPRSGSFRSPRSTPTTRTMSPPPALVGLPGRCRRRGRTTRQASPERQGREAAVHPRGRRRRRRKRHGRRQQEERRPERDVTVDDFIARLGDDVENKV